MAAACSQPTRTYSVRVRAYQPAGRVAFATGYRGAAAGTLGIGGCAAADRGVAPSRTKGDPRQAYRGDRDHSAVRDRLPAAPELLPAAAHRFHRGGHPGLRSPRATIAAARRPHSARLIRAGGKPVSVRRHFAAAAARTAAATLSHAARDVIRVQ